MEAINGAGVGAADVEKGESPASKSPLTDDTSGDDNGPGSEPTTKKLVSHGIDRWKRVSALNAKMAGNMLPTFKHSVCDRSYH